MFRRMPLVFILCNKDFVSKAPRRPDFEIDGDLVRLLRACGAYTPYTYKYIYIYILCTEVLAKTAMR